MTVESLFVSLPESRRLVYDQLLSSMKSEVMNQNKEATCSSWSKSYQTDFAKVKSSKDADLPLIFGLIEEPELPHTLSNSLARTGLGDRSPFNGSEADSTNNFSVLDTYLARIRKGCPKECIEWCLQRASDINPLNRENLLKSLINLELSSVCQYAENTTELATKLRNVRSYVYEVVKIFGKFDITSLELGRVWQSSRTENHDGAKQKVIDQFSSIFMSCMNLPRYDILKVR